MNITGKKEQIIAGNRAYVMNSIDAHTTENKKSAEIIKATSTSATRVERDKIIRNVDRDMKRFMGNDSVDPYDNTPAGRKVPRDKILSISNGQYTTSLLEKILKASDNSEFNNSTLKYQEQSLNYMQTISADIKSIAELLRPKAEEAQEDEDDELKMQISGLAKSLAELNIEGIAKEIGKSIFNKMDSSGYGGIIGTAYGTIRDTIQSGDFGAMVKNMLQGTMLKQLPKEMQQMIQEFREDPVKLMQRQVNRLASSDNRVLRDIFGSMYGGTRPDLELKTKKVDWKAEAKFDNKFYTSVTKVIPEQLYRIVAALEGNEIRAWDWEKGGYMNASEMHARTMQRNLSNSYEAIQDKAMGVFSYMFEQAFEQNSAKMGEIFEVGADNKLTKDQITGHVKFKSTKMKEILTKMATADLEKEQILGANPAWVIRRLGINTQDPVELAQYYDDIKKLQTALKLSDFEDRDDVMGDLISLKEELNKRTKDTTTDFLTDAEQSLYAKIIYNPNMTAAQKNNVLNSIGKKGIRVHGIGDGVVDDGNTKRKGKKRKGRGPSGGGNGTQGAATNTSYDDLVNELNEASLDGVTLSDRDLNKARTYVEDLIAGKRTQYRPNAPAQLTPEMKYRDDITNLSRYGVISVAESKEFLNAKTADKLSDANKAKFDVYKKKLAVALETYTILQQAGYTADYQSKRLGISMTEASKRYINSPSELIDCIDDNGQFLPNKLREKNLTYLTGEDFEYIKKLSTESKRSVLGSGSITKQISNTLSGIFGDPKIAGKAGIAVGSAAGLGVAKLIKDAGIITNPKFGYLLGGVGAGLMSLQSTRSFMNNIFGPEGDIKGKSGFTNKEIFLAKAMTKYLPMVGVGGKSASVIMKAMGAFGPVGKAMGLIAGPILGYGIGLATTSLLDTARKTLFDPTRDPKSKIAKFANFLKDIPGVKKLFALGDDRSDERIYIDALDQLNSFYTSRLMSYKATDNPNSGVIQQYQNAIKAIEDTKSTVLTELKAKENALNQDPPNNEVADKASQAITAAMNNLNTTLDAVNKAGVDINGREKLNQFFEEGKDSRDEANNMKAAADASYNKASTEHLDKVNELVNNYWTASDEHQKNITEALTGNGDMLYETIGDTALRQELEAIVYDGQRGKDVKARYLAWRDKFKAKDANGYESFTSLTSAGGGATKFKEDMVQMIMQYMREEQMFTGTEEELRHVAENMMLNYINNRGLSGTIAKGIGGYTGKVRRHLARIFDSSIDDEDIRKQQEALDVINGIDQDSYDVDSDLDDEGVRGTGGRGTKPVKMKSMKALRFKSGETLDVAGCSVAAVINALVYMGYDAPEPETLVEIANKHITKNGGITSNFIIEVCNKLNLTVNIYNNRDNKFTPKTLRYFKPGKDSGLILLLKNLNNSGYHFVTVKAISGNRVTLDDPEVSGITDTTISDLIIRSIEIISIKGAQETSLKESETTISNKSNIISSKSNEVDIALGNKSSSSDNNDVSDVASSGSSVGSKLSARFSSLIETVKEAFKDLVVNVRIVDDLTLPLRMGDSDAALAVSKAQLSSLDTPGVKVYAANIRKVMQHKDIQNEMAEQDLVQDAILQGGLVAGGSTGAGGKGTSDGAKAPGIFQQIANSNIVDKGKKGLLATFGGLGGALAAGGQYLMSKLTGPLFAAGGKSIKRAYQNLFGEMTEEDRAQKFDENGNQTQDGVFRDVGGSLRLLKDAYSFVRAGVGAHGAVGAVLSNIGKKAVGSSNSVVKAVGKGIMGETKSKLVNLISKACVKLPTKIANMLIKSEKLAAIAGGASIWKETVEGFMEPIKKLFSKIGSKLATQAAEKGSKEMAKKGVLSKFKDFTKKIPGVALAFATAGAVFSAYTGYTHAHQYLGKKPEETSFLNRAGCAIAKVIYDNAVDLIISIVAVAMPVVNVIASLVLAVFRSIVTFEDILEMLGVRKTAETEAKAEQEAKKQAAKDQETKLKQDEAQLNYSDNKSRFIGDFVNENPELANKSVSYKRNAFKVTSSDFTAAHEGFRSKVYLDTENKKTIGYGFNLDSGRFSKEEVDRWMKEGITEKEAQEVLARELDYTRSQLEKYSWFRKLDLVRQGALVDMAYNMGQGSGNGASGLLGFKNMIAALERGDFNTAADEVLNSKYAKQTKGRATEISELIRYGNGTDRLRGEGVIDPNMLDPSLGFPVKSFKMTSNFGDRSISRGSKDHKGIDLRANENTQVLAAKDGMVKNTSSAFNLIEIEHPDGTMTRYLHNSKVFVKPGQQVRKGDVIAMAGGIDENGKNTYDSHLHFEYLKAGQHVDPFKLYGARVGIDNIKLEAAENKAYIARNQEWFRAIGQAKAAERVAASNIPAVSNNTEAGGPSPSSYYSNPALSNNSHTTVINRDAELERYVRTLDAKFDKMIGLLSKLVENSTSNLNNIMSEAIYPAQ